MLIVDAPPITIPPSAPNGDVQQELFEDSEATPQKLKAATQQKKKVVRKKRKVVKKTGKKKVARKK